MHKFSSRLVLIVMLFLLVGCTPFVNNENGDDNEAPAPALNVGGQDDSDENGAEDAGDDAGDDANGGEGEDGDD